MIRLQRAELKQFINFQDDGGGQLEKWPQICGFVFHELSMLHLVCVPNFITIGHKWPTYNIALISEMAATAVSEYDDTLPVSRFLNSACFAQSVYQVSSKSGYKCLVHQT
jgi:hypothetical protein